MTFCFLYKNPTNLTEVCTCINYGLRDATSSFRNNHYIVREIENIEKKQYGFFEDVLT